MPETRENLVVLPTYNEALNIKNILEEITKRAPGFEVLVVDDNSPDGTQAIVADLQRSYPHIHLLLRQKKEGLAPAYISGFHWGIDKGYSFIYQMDADFSHSPSDLKRMRNVLNNYDLVIGSRYTKGGKIEGWPVSRRFISQGGNIYARCLLSTPFKELTGGFNGWRKETLQAIHLETIQSKGYAFQVDMKYRAFRNGFRVIELPIVFKDRVHGVSKMSGQIVWEAAYRVLEIKKQHETPVGATRN